MDKIAFYTAAYNAEQYIGRCIESVLAQTHTNLVYYIVDDASTDKTWEIIQRYAAQDARICATRNAVNIYPRGYSEAFPKICRSDAEWFAMVDNDDRIEPTFAEKLLEAAHKTGAQLAVCGTQFDPEVPTPDAVEIPPRAIRVPLAVMHQADAMRSLGYVHVFFRTIWAKLLRIEILRQFCDEIPAMVYGLDTVVMMQYVQRCEQMVFIHDLLHHWTEYQTSASYRYFPNRMKDVADTDAYTQTCLKVCGGDTEANQLFLAGVNINAVWETLQIATWRMRDVDEVVSLSDILQHPLCLDAWARIQKELSTDGEHEAFRKQKLKWEQNLMEWLQSVRRPVHRPQVWAALVWLAPFLDTFWCEQDAFNMLVDLRLTRAVIQGTPAKAIAYARRCWRKIRLPFPSKPILAMWCKRRRI